jgi:RNA 3'-terminal phosphate cyclase (ATP)
MHIYLLLVAHTSDGFRLGRDKLYGVDGKGAPIRGKKGGQSQKHKGQKSKRPSAEDLESRIEEMMEGCISDLLFELNNGDMRCLDTYMRDQVVVFQALGMVGTQRSKTPTAEGGKDNNQEDVSLHTQTAVWVCEQMLGMKL